MRNVEIMMSVDNKIYIWLQVYINDLFRHIIDGHVAADQVTILGLDPLQVDGGGHGAVQGVVLLGLGPHAECRYCRYIVDIL